MSAAVSAAFGSDPTEVSAARGWLRGQLATLAAAGSARHDVEAVADAELVVSELVTNAIQAGCRRVTVTVEIRADRVVVSVDDDVVGMPRLGMPAVTATHGRGLPIVEAVAAEWGVASLPPGKTIWAALAR